MSEARRRASTPVTVRVIALLSIGLVSGCAVPGTSTAAGAGEPAVVASLLTVLVAAFVIKTSG